jgi:hypothetical protein
MAGYWPGSVSGRAVIRDQACPPRAADGEIVPCGDAGRAPHGATMTGVGGKVERRRPVVGSIVLAACGCRARPRATPDGVYVSHHHPRGAQRYAPTRDPRLGDEVHPGCKNKKVNGREMCG